MHNACKCLKPFTHACTERAKYWCEENELWGRLKKSKKKNLKQMRDGIREREPNMNLKK